MLTSGIKSGMNAVNAPQGRVLPRRAQLAITAALTDTRVVLVTGARQSGKSTLVRQVITPDDTWRSLDQSVTRQAAQFDPTSFVRVPGMLAIDEVQRAPARSHSDRRRKNVVIDAQTAIGDEVDFYPEQFARALDKVSQ